MDDKALVERWPGYDQQSWQERFVELDRQHQNDRNFLIIPMSNTIEAQATRIEALEAALRDVFIHGYSEGWRGNQMRRDVKHVDAEKSWSLYVSNGALAKTIARKTLEGSGND